LETAGKYKKPENMSDVHYICCSYVDCCNEKKTWEKGFMSGYTCWMEHDEYKEVVLEDIDVGGYDDVD
jgi:hypothetical protein